MVSRLISITAILLFILSASCHARASFNSNFVRKQAERLANNFNLSSIDSFNIVQDKVLESAGLVKRTFIFSGILPSNTYSIENLGRHAGYFPIKHSYAARMFYYFFESRGKKSDPVVLWLAGGPGCSGALALFNENGPFHINDDLSLKWNDFGWDKISNLLYIDQPMGTGFSYSSDKRDFRTNETGVANDMYDFLQSFFAAHPEYMKNDFYITGESYAGHFIPALASRVHKGNKVKEGIHINLKGFAIGNGLTDFAYQYPSYTDFALANKLISQSDYKQLKKSNSGCVHAVKRCQSNNSECMYAFYFCHSILEDILSIMGPINEYDIRKKYVNKKCYDFSNLDKFMNLASVKKALGIGNIRFVRYRKSIFQAMIEDIPKNYAPKIPPLLENGIKVLIFAGEFDLICNWLGNLRWVNAMKWSGHMQFRQAKLTSYKVGGRKVGQVKSIGPLTFLKVHKAGHHVPMDQPNVSLQMLKNWMNAQTIE